jgi:hypothetical protein
MAPVEVAVLKAYVASATLSTTGRTMVKKFLYALASGAAIVLWANSAAAQTVETTEEIIAAAVGHASSSMWASEKAVPQDARVGLDVTVLPLEGQDRRENRARAEAVARRANVQAANATEAIRCDNGPRSCRMDFDIFLTLSEPIVIGDSATVTLMRRVWTPSRTRQPISWTAWELTLTRAEGRWAVVNAKPIAQS